jgi:hypothetical protein
LSADGKRVILVPQHSVLDNKKVSVFEIETCVWNGTYWEQSIYTQKASKIQDVAFAKNGTVLGVAYKKYSDSIVQLYEWVSKQWKPMGKPLSEEQLISGFGQQLALSGDGTRLVVSAADYIVEEENNIHQVGKLYAYAWNGVAWQPKGTVTGSFLEAPLFKTYRDSTVFSIEKEIALSQDGTVLLVQLWRQTRRRDEPAIGVFTWETVQLSQTPMQYLTYTRRHKAFGYHLHLSAKGQILGVELQLYDTKKEHERRGIVLYNKKGNCWKAHKILVLAGLPQQFEKKPTFGLSFDGHRVRVIPCTINRNRQKLLTNQYRYSR